MELRQSSSDATIILLGSYDTHKFSHFVTFLVGFYCSKNCVVYRIMTITSIPSSWNIAPNSQLFQQWPSLFLILFIHYVRFLVLDVSSVPSIFSHFCLLPLGECRKHFSIFQRRGRKDIYRCCVVTAGGYRHARHS